MIRKILMLNTPFSEVFGIPETHTGCLTAQKNHYILSMLVSKARSQTRSGRVGETCLDTYILIRMFCDEFVSVVPLNANTSAPC
jgi:hypothetical protein